MSKGGSNSDVSQTISILVVDDSNISSKLAIHNLSSEGHRVMHAENGHLALELLRRIPDDFDLVLLDIVMPIMDGIEVLTTMKADETLAHIPVLMLSGLSDDDLGNLCGNFRAPLHYIYMFLTFTVLCSRSMS